MIHVDTHVLVWLYEGAEERFTRQGLVLLEAEQIVASPMAALELSWLNETGKIASEPAEMLSWLRAALSLRVDETPFGDVAAAASGAMFAFTRDPFDRLIAAYAHTAGATLLTKDRQLRANLEFAVWP